jgi:hypothetical protein
MLKNLAVAGALVMGVVGFAGTADGQVIGTRGTSLAPLGYYSPYPGALYSPFASPPRVYGFAQPRYVSPFVTPGFGTTVVSPRYYGLSRSYSPGFHASPHYGHRSYRRW